MIFGTLLPNIPRFSNQDNPDLENQTSYEFICTEDQKESSAISVLEKTKDHNLFISYLENYDPEGYQILLDPDLADKVIWAPTDAAFLEIDSMLESMTTDEIKIILGYHISPPLSSPYGEYPIVDFEYLKNNTSVILRTRTGVLTGSDQRITATYINDTYEIESITIQSQAYCTKAGSIFSIEEVITDVTPPSFITKVGYRLVRILFYEDIRFVIYSTTASIFIATSTIVVYSKISKRKKNEKNS